MGSSLSLGLLLNVLRSLSKWKTTFMAQFSKERVKWVGFSDLDISGNLSYSGLYGVHNNGAGGGGGARGGLS